MEKNLERYLKICVKSEQVSDIFAHFIMNEWVFDDKKCDMLMAKMSKEESEIFILDTT